MEAAWINDNRAQLRRIYEDCKNNKASVLGVFSVYLLRILNGLSQMESSKLHGYEEQILGGSMELFYEHYIAQVERAVDPNISTEEKKKIIGDIEDAISKISNVYKNVIDSTANSDRQMFTSQAVETSIYDISPKLFATYSVILETLVRLFGKEKTYAFLLHPSLKSNIEAVSLFDMREIEGKVVLIYIPENEIEQIKQIPIYLLHEAFHVLTKEERNRKDRACCLELHVRNAISQRIFRNVNFSFLDENDTGDTIKGKLMERWFDIDKRMQELDGIDKNDRKLYSKNITKQICENWRKWLSNIFETLGKDLCQILDGVECKRGENVYSHFVQIEWIIQQNLVEILAGNLVERYVHIFLSIYREAYADIACVLTTGILPGEYERAFEDSVLVPDEYQRDIIRALRIHVVAKAIVACDGVNCAEEWKEYSEINDFRHRRESQIQIVDEKIDCNDAIQIFDMDLQHFEKVLTDCSQKLWSQLGKKDSGFERFRDIIKNMDLIEILDGEVNKKLYTL